MIPEISARDELTTDVPRPARFTTSTQAARVFLLLLVVFSVGFLCYLADRDLGDMNALKAHGRTTLAHVTGKHITQGKSISYSLEYDFKVDGDWVYGDKNVSEDVYADTRPGVALLVTYLPSRPETYALGAMTQGRVEAQQSRWLWGDSGALVFFGLLLIGAEVTFRRHLSLLRDGSVAAGIIIERSAGASQKEFCVTYQFLAEGRFAVESKSHSTKLSCTQSFYEQTEMGQGLTILYSPAHPSQNIPYRMLTDVTLSHR